MNFTFHNMHDNNVIYSKISLTRLEKSLTKCTVNILTT